ncbi:MAG: hypothetical protein OXC13_18980 [Caldilineaceae bacterium]|nr:hypothetical protein [Caldilineaceae bacterium]
MKSLTDHVRVARRFQRSVRIDTDLADPAALEGFICPRTSVAALMTMARHVSGTGQAAFTWTGPYGTGKSSLAVALAATLNGRIELRRTAAAALGNGTAEAIWNVLPPQEKGWRILPIVGRRGRPAQAVGKALENARFVRGSRSTEWSDSEILDKLAEVAKRTPHTSGGLIVLIDEMGKFLEGAAHDGTDIYFFQELAELAVRSRRRLIVIGILHQAFEEYGHRLSREMRDEWAKIQGRFVDLAISATPEEQLDLISRAIENGRRPSSRPDECATKVATLTGQPATAGLLEGCWPLHPIVACLLGPISRRRFGQNQRSIFAFLNSTEPKGFQDFLRTASATDLYTPELLWDYLRFNLEPSIMASPDGHRWALAVEVVERLEATDADSLHLQLLKTIGLVNLFKERSGLAPGFELLNVALPKHSSKEIGRALNDLLQLSLIIYRRHANAYSIFEGSDFDIEQAVEEVYELIGTLDHAQLTALADFQPIIAKRHYHETGTLRWYDITVVPLGELSETAASYVPTDGSTGGFLLALPIEGDSPQQAEWMACEAAESNDRYDLVIGVADRSAWVVSTLAKELLALEHVRDQTPELQGDRVARMEVSSRIIELQGRIEAELGQVFNGARWHRQGHPVVQLDHAQLNSLASDLASERFCLTPYLHNELLNRTKPSSNAVAARNALLHRMVLNEGQERLGIVGFPAEGSLFTSLIEGPGLYANGDDGWRFVRPLAQSKGSLAPMWHAARELVRSNSHRSVSAAEIYGVWREPPFGIKNGLLPVLAAAFMLSNRQDLAYYREGIFQARITDLDMDFLTRDPNDVQVRWMDLSSASRQLLSDLADVVREIDTGNRLADLQPIDVARGLVAIHDELPAWTGRTRQLSANARLVRQLLKHAKDPNKLLFDDLPQVLSDPVKSGREVDLQLVAARMREGLHELRDSYPTMLRRLRDMLLAELQVPNASSRSLDELRARARNIQELGADHRQEAFTVRIARFQGTDADIESLASLALNKPSNAWTDHDVDHAAVVLASMAQEFVRSEAFAHVKGRADKRHAMAVVVGMDGLSNIAHNEFDVTDADRPLIEALSAQIEEVLDCNGDSRDNIILAALAKVSVRHMGHE